jgi:sterol desaturase/sphingolipid hydroxylase (fatty acid hydroxylase superfamily)
MTMDEGTFQVIRGVSLAVAVGLGFALEIRRPHSRRPPRRSHNVYLWAVNAVVIGVVCGACVCTAARWASVSHVGLLNLLRAPLWIAVPVAVACLDAVSYGWHRANHRLPLLWRFHRVHHLDRTPNFSTALRFHPGELLLSLPVRLLAVVALGVPVEGIVVFEVLFGWANVLEHGDFDAPLAPEQKVARLLVTPALHRLHHSSERDDLDTNFGTVFTVWDRCLGTYRSSSSALHFVAGVPGRAQLPEPTILGLLAEPLRA